MAGGKRAIVPHNVHLGILTVEELLMPDSLAKEEREARADEAKLRGLSSLKSSQEPTSFMLTLNLASSLANACL